MSAPLTLSVVIPTYDEPERLEAALKSLSQQDYPHEATQIIVVDDASPHLDAKRLHAAVAPLQLQLLRNEQNQGRARARNAALRVASGDLVVFLDSDMTVGANFLRAHAEQHQNHAEAVFVGNIRFAREIPSTSLTRYLEGRGVHRADLDKPIPFNCFVTGNSSVLRSSLLRVGFFDENLTAYGGEDLELGYRLHLAGIPLYYAPEALSYHYHLRSLEPLCRLMQTYGNKSIPILLNKHPELDAVLRLDFIRASGFSPRRLALQLALLPLIHYPIRWLTRWVVKTYVPDLFFSYLFWSSRTRGYLQAIAHSKAS
ncbi:MAG: glycosyltransferase [Gemmatimonadetes bacterium]|nr:glycosyltransferase [Gemmatimonadota bacterium]MDE2733033.1 glycosyltransferase [Gemmatimonadota bacterium]